MKQRTTRLLSILLVLCMMLALLPRAAWAVASGTCGNNLTWTPSADGTLTITGTGAMWDYALYSAPWLGRDAITSVVIGSGVTNISDNAFLDCTNLTSVTIPASVITIGGLAFLFCSSLTDVYYGSNESQWNQISIDSSAWALKPTENANAPLLNANIHYNSPSPSTRPTEPSAPAFTDVSAGDWYYDAVMNAARKGLIQGIGGNSFAPAKQLTRAEFITLIVRLVNGGEPVDTSGEWYAKYYTYANAHNLLYRIPTDIDVIGAIPRYEMAQMIYNSVKAKGLDGFASVSFTDYGAGSYSSSYNTAISYAYATGLLTGKGDTLGFAGADTLTRAEATTVVWRFYVLIND